MRNLFLLAILTLTLTCLAQLKSCYSNNYVARGQTIDIPCDPSANVSACCPRGLMCATNFFCRDPDGFNRMGSCTDKTGQNPACPLPLLQEPGAVNYFDYNTNTTECSDGTFCPNLGNETCCFNHEGVGEITFHNNATIPTLAAELSTYYEAAGYSIPTPTSSTSTSIAIASESIFISRISTITSAGSLGLRPSSTQPVPTATSGLTPALTTSASLSSGGEAGIITAGCVCAIVIEVLLYLLRRSRKKRLTQPGFETKVDGLQCEKAEMSGHDARTEMDAVEGCNLQDMRPIGRNELMGHEWSELRVEMPN